MNLCFVCNQYPPLRQGGHGSRTSVLARRLVERGHRVTVVGVVPANVGLEKPTEELLDGVRVFRLPASAKRWRWRPGELWARWRLARLISRLHGREPFDLVDCADSAGWMCFGVPSGVALTVRFAATHKLYGDLGQGFADPFIVELERRTLAHGTHFYSPSRWAANETLRVFGYGSVPCEVIHNAVDVEVFAPAAAATTQPGLVVYAGAIEPRKGVRELVASMNHWGKTHPNARLVLVGSETYEPVNGQTFADVCLQDLAPALRDRVQFTGHLGRDTGMLSWLRSAQLCAYPSHLETFGIAPVEAMAVGKPVVFSRTGSGPELIEDGVSGLLCDPTSPGDIAAKIQRLLDAPQLCADMGQQARVRVLERFNDQTWAGQCEAFYQRCIADFARTRQRIGAATRRLP